MGFILFIFIFLFLGCTNRSNLKGTSESRTTKRSNHNICNRRPSKMPIPQTLHRVSTKVKKFLSCGHYRLRAGSQNPCHSRGEKNLEKPAPIGKSIEKGREIKHHFNLWDPLKQKTKSVSGIKLTSIPFVFFFLGFCCMIISVGKMSARSTLLFPQEWFPKRPLSC